MRPIHGPSAHAALVLGLLALAAPASAGRQEKGHRGRDVPLEIAVPRMDTAAAQLDHARRTKARTFRAHEGEEREFWRELAVEAYQAVRVFHPEARELGAEASFRAGELLRAAGREDEARSEFEQAVRLGAGTPFRARARLELGHLHRRAGRTREALDAFLAVASDAAAAPARREDAWVWAGRVWWDDGRPGEARRAWNGVVERALDPFAVVRASDALALAWVAEDDPEAAAGELARCRRVLLPIVLEETERGERLRNAMLSMHALEALRDAVRERSDARRESESGQGRRAVRPRNA